LEQDGDGWEAAARAARYSFLLSAAQRLGARFVATAHTTDDQAETVLQRIVRGTGLAGLAGISFSRPLSAGIALVRPLLGVGRRDVVAYLAAIGQDSRLDGTNDDRRFMRNRLRHDVLPLLRSLCNADVDSALVRLAQQAREAHAWLSETAEPMAAQAVTSTTADEVRIACGPLTNQPPLVIREVCRAAWTRAGWPVQAMGFDEWRQLSELVLAEDEPSVLMLPGEIRACRSHGQVLLARVMRKS
jgi:tRNA(Ile)-lysidine synthase